VRISEQEMPVIQPTPSSEILLVKLIVTQLLKNGQAFRGTVEGPPLDPSLAT
jgi:hypothetical protein